MYMCILQKLLTSNSNEICQICCNNTRRKGFIFKGSATLPQPKGRAPALQNFGSPTATTA